MATCLGAGGKERDTEAADRLMCVGVGVAPWRRYTRGEQQQAAGME